MRLPSGENAGAVSRKPRVKRRGGVDPFVAATHNWPTVASAPRSGWVAEKTTVEPSGFSDGDETENSRGSSSAFTRAYLEPRKSVTSPT